jgi:hypothetical protein
VFYRKLAAETHSTCVGIVRGAHGNRKHADARGGHLGLSRGGGGLGGGNCTGEDEDGDESANDALHGLALFKLFLVITDKNMVWQDWQALKLAAETHTAGVRIIRSAHGNRKHADLSGGDLVLSGSGGGLGGSNCSGEDEDGDESADDMFHDGIPLKLYSQKKISLDKANGVTIGYIME